MSHEMPVINCEQGSDTIKILYLNSGATMKMGLEIEIGGWANDYIAVVKWVDGPNHVESWPH